jgi:prefoldin subunit 5
LISIAERLDKVQVTLQSQQLSTKQTLKELEEIIEQINQYNQQLVEKVLTIKHSLYLPC